MYGELQAQIGISTARLYTHWTSHKTSDDYSENLEAHSSLTLHAGASRHCSVINNETFKKEEMLALSVFKTELSREKIGNCVGSPLRGTASSTAKYICPTCECLAAG